MPSGYYRFPTLFANWVVFVCEDDLWTVSSEGGIARRLTSNLGEVSRPILSTDGEQLAFVGREEGQGEIYCMPAMGGPARRLTYLGSTLCQTAVWTRAGKILFASNAGHWETGFSFLYAVDPNPHSTEYNPQRLNFGLARAIAFGPAGGIILGRYTADPARWKRYRGGMAGQFWIDPDGTGEFQPFLRRLNSNLASPMWIDIGKPGYPATGRIYFISDHEGVGNLYSCMPDGEDLRRHTDHEDYYVRNANTDGQRIVYHAGGDLYLFDPAQEITQQIPVEFHSPQTQRNRKYVNAERYLESWDLHPQGHSIIITARGSAYTLGNWEGPVLQHRPVEAGPENGLQDPSHPATAARVRLPHWLPDGNRFVAVSDAGGEEAFYIFHADGSQLPQRLPDLDIGRPIAIAVNPVKDLIAFSNHRYELLCLDLSNYELRPIDRGRATMVEKGLTQAISGFSWSPDGEWLVYSASQSLQIAQLKLWKVASGEIFPLTRPVLRDISPTFDPQGRYIYFLSYRYFDPVYDNLQFDLNFPRGMQPYLITLQKDLPNPFIPCLKKEEPRKSDPTAGQSEGSKDEVTPDEQSEGQDEEPEREEKAIRIDLDGIETRIVAFQTEEGLFGRVLGGKEGKIFYTCLPIEGGLSQSFFNSEPSANGTLLVYNLEDQKEEILVSGVTDFKLTPDGGMLIYRAGNRLRVFKVGEHPEERFTPGRKSGWINLERVKVSVLPGAEWRQMFREAWRLQRDQFWTKDMSQVDWLSVHERYLPLVDRVSSRSEFSDLMWEMQGELGTSHAYEFGGDYRPGPYYGLGFLGADFEFDEQNDAWRITHIVHGDPWDPKADSPLNGPGINVQVGDLLVAINGRKLSRFLPPAACLVNLAGEEVLLLVAPATGLMEKSFEAESKTEQNGSHTFRTVTIKTLRSEGPARYREWVESNRQSVHAASQGQVGYLHIPDMGPRGYAEFHRGYLAEVDRHGLIIDVRFNGGGHVSELLLEKLARRRIGYDLTRWSEQAVPYPLESVSGPMVALTNELAGSDGDIFSHGFKMLKLGPLLGKRTWGGVIGIDPRHMLVDGTVTTQPEFSFWFSDVGWRVENYGTDPDNEVEIAPQDYARGSDPQLEQAIRMILELLKGAPPPLPEFGSRPDRSWPRLPKR